MRILITGAGLIGCYTAAQMIDSGHEVVLFDVSPRMGYIRNVLRDREVSVRTGDIVDIGNLPDLQPVHRIGKVDMIVHTAGVIGGAARANPYGAMRTNLVGTVELAKAAQSAGVRRIVYASTHGVYELEKVREAPFLETAPVSAHSLYGATKLSSEHVLRAFGEVYEIQITVLRFPNVYGYGEFVGGSSGGIAFQELLVAAMHNVPIAIPQLLNGYGEWLYSKDAARAIQNALEHSITKPYVVANVGNGVLHDENDIVRSVTTLFPGAQFRSSRDEDAAPRSTERHVAFDLSTAKREIGYYPRFNLDDGISDHVEELKRANV